MASKISFPEGWFNIQPSVDPPSRPKKVKKGAHATNKTNPPPEDPINLVIMGLLGLGLDKGKSKKIPKVDKQRQKVQANKQRNKNTSFPNTGKIKKSKASNTKVRCPTRCPTGLNPKEECIICNGPHSNLMFCPKLTRYLPFGRYQTPPGCLCVKCLSTRHWNAKNCNHKSNRFYKTQLCPTSEKHFLMCTGCEHHLPVIRYMKSHHEPLIGFKNFSLIRQCFGDEMYRSMKSNCKGDCLA